MTQKTNSSASLNLDHEPQSLPSSGNKTKERFQKVVIHKVTFKWHIFPHIWWKIPDACELFVFVDSFSAGPVTQLETLKVKLRTVLIVCDVLCWAFHIVT